MQKIKQSTEDISRKEAIKKLGKYAALTSLGTFLILSPQRAQAASPDKAWNDKESNW